MTLMSRGWSRLRVNFVVRALVISVALPLMSGALFAQTAKPGSFIVQGDHFLLNGKPVEILSGEIHYARIPRAYWKERMEMAKAMGLNTIATYVFWNVHEPQPGVYDFSGNNDLAAFLKLAQQEHLYVLLRAGPYACAEWEFGGFPAWLLKDPKAGAALRTNDPAFMVPAERWIRRLAKEIAPLQIGNGGPIIATQIENEYGNFGSDQSYMEHMRDVFVAAGFTKSLLYTVDPSKALARGEIPGIYSGVNFGTGNAERGLAAQAKLRPGQPLFSTEYWPGWFDLWGHPHETRPIAPQLADLEYMLSHDASVNIYMFHGGTSFGMMAGASQSTGSYRGNVTSYDYDAPLDEAGHPTAKFYAYRDLILKYTHEKALPLPAVAPVVKIPAFTLRSVARYDAKLKTPVEAKSPLTMEQIGQAYGYVLYRTTLPEAVKDAALVMDPVHDYAQVSVDGKLVGTLDRHYHQTIVMLTAAKGARLDVLVENTGRLNSTKFMREEWKGIRSAVLGGKELTGWKMYSVAADERADVRADAVAKSGAGSVAHWAVGSFEMRSIGDGFLDVSQLGKGVLWLNGHCLGRFWNIGPQNTLYVPGPWLKEGRNTVVVFDLFAATTEPKLEGRMKPILDGPTPGYEKDPERKKKKAADAEFGPKLTSPQNNTSPQSNKE
ncbi:MAG: beta-galactosidase family protein [Acidobacteriaceae bacterium]